MEEKLYQLITSKEERESLEYGDISKQASEHVPENFGKQVLSLTATKCGDQLSKPGLILTWLLSMLGAPTAAIGMLAPIRESGSMLPQIMLGGFIRRYPKRKWFWVIGSILQGISVLGMGVVALLMEGAAAGWSIIGLVVIFSLSRAICSISSKSLLGKTIPKKNRGRLGGLAASLAGWFAVAVGVFFVFYRAEELPLWLIATLLFVAGGLWLIAAAIMSGVIEEDSEVERRDDLLADALESLSILKEDKVFMRFCIARALMASTVLSMPFYVVLAHSSTGGLTAGLGVLMLAGSLATALSGITWGKLSDKSSRLTMSVAGISAGLIGCLTFALAGWQLSETPSTWLYGILFFLIGLAHTGIRTGRKTYIVDHANKDNRSRLVAVSNTLMGLVLLLSGSFGLLADAIGERYVILVFALLGIIGGILSWTLPEVEDK